MTPSQLKREVLAKDPESQFFTRKTMAFFGDTMKNYGVRKTTIAPKGWQGTVTVWELYREKSVKAGNKDSAFFNAETFERIIHNQKTFNYPAL